MLSGTEIFTFIVSGHHKEISTWEVRKQLKEVSGNFGTYQLILGEGG